MKYLTRLVPAIAVALALSAAPAQAREYVVHSCKTPDGHPAPTDGWSTNGSAPYMWFDNACASGGSLTAGLAGLLQPANSSTIGWGFNSGVATIKGYRIVRDGAPRGYNGGASMLVYSSDAENNAHSGKAVDYCAAFRGCTGVGGVLIRSAATIPVDSRAWFFSLVCGGNAGGSCAPPSAGSDFGYLRIEAASFTLADAEAPQTNSSGGELVNPENNSGSLNLIATDRVSGVRRATLELDGSPVASFEPAADVRCREVGQSSLPDFLYMRPCPAQLQAELELSPAQIPPGEHSLRARVFDAAGNSTTAFGPRKIQGPTAPIAAKSLATRIELDGPVERVARFGRRVVVSGRLISGQGVVLPGARIELAASSRAARPKLRGFAAVTDSSGRFHLSFTARSNRTVTATEPGSGASMSQVLRVRSEIKFRAVRSRVKPLGRMQLRGSLASDRAVKRSSIAIEVRSGRRWKTIGLASLSRQGKFHFGYRFRRTRSARFYFRARAVRSSDLAVIAEPSKRVRVRVG